MDIQSLLKSSGVDAERTATQAFGNAVEQFGAGKLNTALQNQFGKGDNAVVNRTGQDGTWYSTSYAHSLANSQFRPKLKFLFRVEFLFKPEVLAQFNAQSAAWLRNFTFMIKSVDRPKIDFEYEDINQYNFNTKVLRKIKHRELTVTFMDDVGNNVHEFFRFMMMVHSPITRRSIGGSFDIAAAYAHYSAGSGMEFSKDILGANTDYAHRGVINTDIGNVIQAIKITQMFMQPGKTRQDLDTNAKEVAFFFINPRMVSFDLDDVSHEVSDPNLFTMQFDYDFMVMSDMRVLQPLDASKSVPPLGTAPGEVAPTGRAGKGSTSPSGGNNPYTSMLQGVAGRAAQKLTSETIGRRIRQVPGLGSVADTIGGLAQGATSDRIGGMVSNISQSFARPSRAVVSDSTGQASTATYTTSTGAFGSGQPTPGGGG